MKTTGVIRRVDEMGRIVLPKELRRKYRLETDTPVEFFIDNDSLILKKFLEDDTDNDTVKSKKAIVAGSFDPFTNGHLSVVKKASEMFDEITVAIGINTNKCRHYSADEMSKAISETLQENGLDNCKVEVVDGLIAKYCSENGIRYSVRGLRNNMDFNYESEISKINRLINPNLETVYLPSDNDAISSSMVREFLQFGLSVKEYVPNAVYKIL